MSYSLPTLSAALAAQTVPVNSELTIDDGTLPKRGLYHDIASQSNGIASPNHGGFQPSSIRDEDMRWSASSTRIVTPWEDKENAYRDTKQYPLAELPEGSQCSPVKPYKRARFSKSEATLPEIPPNAEEYDREDPSGIHTLEPVYVHDLKSDNTALTAQIASAQDRIAHLESLVSTLERARNAAFAPTTSWPEAPTRPDFASLAKNILSVRSTALTPAFGAISMNVLQSDREITLAPSHNQPAITYPPHEVALQAVESYFLCNAISYPFIDKSELLRDMDDAYASHGQERNDFVLLMVIAIGTTNQERIGQSERGASKVFGERAMTRLSAAVAREDVLCVQSLLLLAIYSMFDPSEISLWHLVGFAARVTVALNLHRRVDDPSLPLRVVEQRKRVFYSLYNLDRLVSTTLSKPLAIADDDIDVELPSVLIDDSPYRSFPRIAFTQHIVRIRRLSGVILTKVYSVSGSQNSLPEPERAAIIDGLHSRLDQWVADCPTPPAEEAEKPGMINNHAWFLLNYHQALCLLFRPSPLYPISTPDRLSALFRASTRCVDLYLDLWREQKVSYNLINISSQFIVCISLLYCLCEYTNRSARPATDPSWHGEVSSRVSQCHELLEAFGSALPETAKYRDIFGKLCEILLARQGESEATKPTHGLPLDATHSTSVPVPGILIKSSTGETAWDAMTQLWHDSGDLGWNYDGVSGEMDEKSGLGMSVTDNSVADVLNTGLREARSKELAPEMDPVFSASRGQGSGYTPLLWNELG
ncbi:MAG: hypothetical protein TREMPRED_001181 [Tremellales sp. Tagirdzhanova-0007]|nr:MAG: hypothetical protein TREMPRED_001181 [Tremellales sp. Tagirdzhanova-0007]